MDNSLVVASKYSLPLSEISHLILGGEVVFQSLEFLDCHEFLDLVKGPGWDGGWDTMRSDNTFSPLGLSVDSLDRTPIATPLMSPMTVMASAPPTLKRDGTLPMTDSWKENYNPNRSSKMLTPSLDVVSLEEHQRGSQGDMKGALQSPTGFVHNSILKKSCDLPQHVRSRIGSRRGSVDPDLSLMTMDIPDNREMVIEEEIQLKRGSQQKAGRKTMQANHTGTLDLVYY